MYDNSTIVIDSKGEGLNRYIAKVFLWMFMGLGLTALSTWAIVTWISPAFPEVFSYLTHSLLVIFLLQVLLVGWVAVRIEKMRTSTAMALYITYALVNGLTIGYGAWVLASVNSGAITAAFGITAISFGVMAIFGLKTQQDLTRAGNLFRMGLIGIIVLSVVNWFIGSAPLDFLICIAGLFIFLGLTAYHTSQIKNYYHHASGDVRLANNLAIIGALMLYLSFINLFMFILRLMTGRR